MKAEVERIVGRSLHIGVNSVKPEHYAQFSGNLVGCENDARLMHKIATYHGFDARPPLLGPNATAKAVLDEIENASRNLPDGSFFMVTFAGHGGQVANPNPKYEVFNQTWAVYDRQIQDDELYACWPSFKKSTRILVISDSCHSGTILSRLFTLNEDRVRFRTLPEEVIEATYLQNQELYDSISNSLIRPTPQDIKASVISISACQDDENAADGDPHGAFTAALCNIWNGGKFASSHEELWKDIHFAVSPYYPQNPKWFYAGTLDLGFWHAQAFVIS